MLRSDHARLEGLIDLEVMQNARVSCVGVGGAAGLIVSLAKLGVGKITICDHDTVSTTNPATQGYDLRHVGMPKVEALQQAILSNNPQCEVEIHPEKVQSLSANSLVNLWDCNLMLAMTDEFIVQAWLNRGACRNKVDTIFAGGYPGASAIEIAGTFADTIEQGLGCQRCFTFLRYQAHANGYENPDVTNSHVLQAEIRNAQAGLLAVSLIHYRAGSKLGNPDLARRFLRQPFIVSRIDPTYHAGADEAFGDAPMGFELFTTRQWPREVPRDFVCADCGASSTAAPPSDHAAK